MRKSSDTLVGVVIVAGVALVVGGTLWLQGADLWRDVTEVRAQVDEVGMLSEGNPVRMRGVRVGRVGDLTVAPDGRSVHVTLRVDAEVHMPEDPAVVLAPESMFGDWQAEVVSRRDFPHFSYTSPDDPDFLPGYAMPDITRLTATADRISENMAEITERLSLAFGEETAESLVRMVGNVEEVSADLSELLERQSDAMTEVAADMSGTAQEIGRTAATTRRTVERTDSIIGSAAVSSILDDAQATSGNLRALSGDLAATNQDLRQMTQRVDTTFARVDRVTAQLEGGQGTIGQLFSEPGLAEELNTSMVQLQMLLEDVRENPRRYFRLSVF